MSVHSLALSPGLYKTWICCQLNNSILSLLKRSVDSLVNTCCVCSHYMHSFVPLLPLFSLNCSSPMYCLNLFYLPSRNVLTFCGKPAALLPFEPHHWVHERLSYSSASNPRFGSCHLQGKVSINYIAHPPQLYNYFVSDNDGAMIAIEFLLAHSPVQ